MFDMKLMIELIPLLFGWVDLRSSNNRELIMLCLSARQPLIDFSKDVNRANYCILFCYFNKNMSWSLDLRSSVFTLKVQ
jgi:hypothetical protein